MSALTATYKFTVEEYYRLYETGILDENERIELLNGNLNLMQAIGSRHARAVDNLTFEFGECRRFMISLQNPVELDRLSVPQPDLVLVPVDRRRKGHTKPGDVLLVVEVSDSSLRYDRETKLRAYARNGIKEYWIVNLVDDVVEVFRQPQDDAYLEIASFGVDATVAPAAFPDLVLKVSDLIPAR